MLKQVFEIGLSTGDTQTALLNGIHYIQKSLVSGVNISVLKKECDYQMQLIGAHSLPMSKMYTSAWQETIALLIANEGLSNLTRSDLSEESLYDKYSSEESLLLAFRPAGGKTLGILVNLHRIVQ